MSQKPIRFLRVDNLAQIYNKTLKHEGGLAVNRDRGKVYNNLL